jgi:hypothetical protein
MLEPAPIKNFNSVIAHVYVPYPFLMGPCQENNNNWDFHMLEVGTPNKILRIALDSAPAPPSLALAWGLVKGEKIKIFTC